VYVTTTTTDDPERLKSGSCVKYNGEVKRWIDYNQGSKPARQIAEELFDYNKNNSRVVQRNTSKGDLTNITPTFYVYNNPNDPRYPSVAGEIKAELKPIFLGRVLNSNIPINCKSQAATHYIVYENNVNKGWNKIPADAWPDPGDVRTGTSGQREMP
jgi:hypothetical protein